MDNAEIQRLVGKLVIDTYLSNLQVEDQLKKLLAENNQLKEQLVQAQVQCNGQEQ